MSVSLSGPIAPHTGYGVDGRDGDFGVKPMPRVRPEAQHIASHHQGTVGNLFELQGTRVPLAQFRPRSVPKDHMKANARRMRQIQRASRQREEEANKPVKAIWQSSKYEHVQSKVAEELQKEPLAPRPSSANFLRAHSRTGSYSSSQAGSRPGSVAGSFAGSRPGSAAGSRPGSAAGSRPASARSYSRPSSVERLDISQAQSAREVKLIRRDIDFIKVNGRAVTHSSMKRAPSLTALDDLKKKQEDQQKNYRRGSVPKYLVNRQQEWEESEQERIANIPDPDCPPGHHKMPEEERLKTLALLRNKEQSYLKQLQSLPVRTDTVRMKSRKNELEQKLSEIEEALKVFNRPKVFVKDDG